MSAAQRAMEEYEEEIKVFRKFDEGSYCLLCVCDTERKKPKLIFAIKIELVAQQTKTQKLVTQKNENELVKQVRLWISPPPNSKPLPLANYCEASVVFS
jgi:hypothetical protein